MQGICTIACQLRDSLILVPKARDLTLGHVEVELLMLSLQSFDVGLQGLDRPWPWTSSTGSYVSSAFGN